MSGHTPGPWGIYRDGLSVAETKGRSGICEIWERHGGEGFENARLIAAAPELLEFADLFIERNGTDETWMTSKARAAIAKARGQ